MKDIILYTKKIELKFDESSVAVNNLHDLISEIEKKYKIVDPHPIINTFEKFQLITFRVVAKPKEPKQTLGFNIPSK